MDVLDKAMVVILLQCINVSNLYLVYLKLTQCYICQLYFKKVSWATSPEILVQ